MHEKKRHTLGAAAKSRKSQSRAAMKTALRKGEGGKKSQQQARPAEQPKTCSTPNESSKILRRSKFQPARPASVSNAFQPLSTLGTELKVRQMQ
ncbi:MAG: hypothetical protein KAY08_01350 [Giesbergeria sp.]|nr:hypothetical protein [Giesbergeria sp.]MBP8091459.1 hypothetical protein [Giesbergeria sp.]